MLFRLFCSYWIKFRQYTSIAYFIFNMLDVRIFLLIQYVSLAIYKIFVLYFVLNRDNSFLLLEIE